MRVLYHHFKKEEKYHAVSKKIKTAYRADSRSGADGDGHPAAHVLDAPCGLLAEPRMDRTEALLDGHTGRDRGKHAMTQKDLFRWGTGIYKGMDNSYCFCVANHTGQAGKGQEGYLEEGAGALLIQDYALFKGNRDVRYENKPFYGFCGFMSEQDALFERLARERNITVEEMKEIISARILKGWNDTNPIK